MSSYRIQIIQTGNDKPLLDVTVDNLRLGKEFAGAEDGFAIYEHSIKFKQTETERAETLELMENARAGGARLACQDVIFEPRQKVKIITQKISRTSKGKTLCQKALRVEEAK